MKKCPYIKWYETNNKVYLDIINYSNNSQINIENNNLYYNDDLYEINTEFFSDCELDKYSYKNNILEIILNKKNENKWSYIFKNKNKYTYFVSTNWDKVIDNDMFLKENIDYDSDEFNSLLKSGILDNISSSSDDELQDNLQTELQDKLSDELQDKLKDENNIKNEKINENKKIKII
tara:strand:+ start:82 stop:612 length:531 start_codon:yes stop_codon:yes gene_type:complete